VANAEPVVTDDMATGTPWPNLFRLVGRNTRGGRLDESLSQNEARRGIMAKRWQVVVKGVGVAFPSPETLQQDLTARVGGAIKVENVHNFEVHGPQNFYTLEAADSVDAETLKGLVAQSIRVYVPEEAQYTIEVTAAND
jgi:hypothetical protein